MRFSRSNLQDQREELPFNEISGGVAYTVEALLTHTPAPGHLGCF